MSVHFFRRLAGFAGASIVLALAASLSACSTPISTPVPPATKASLINEGRDGLLVLLSAERSDTRGRASIGLPVQMDGKAVYLMLDTGTTGVRVLSKVLPRSSYPVAGMRTSYTFATDAQVSGATVTVPFSIAGTKPVDLAVQAVDEVSCLKINKRCVAQDGYTGEFGWAFSGILGIGDIFNCRVAGNVENTDILGSMEFACKLSGAKVVVVMGHTACGAIKGAIANAELGNLTALLDKIKPAVQATEYTGERSATNYEFVNAVARKNVELTIGNIRRDSPVLADMEQQGAIKIVGAMYNLSTGALAFFP
jgi:hypothetical protein